MLSCSGIVKAFGDNEVLHNVDLTVKPGGINVLIGPSGSGKSTLIKALSMTEPADRGTIVIDDARYEFPLGKRTRLKPVWPTVTVVFQSLALWPHMTLRQNILFPLRYRNAEEKSVSLAEYQELFEMQEFLDRYPNEVSLGQRQRAAIVRALMLEPRYLLLDEITAALDVEQVSRVFECLKSLKKNNVGILIVTHLLSFARKTADSVSFIDEGKILETGGKEMLSQPKSERVKRFVELV